MKRVLIISYYWPPAGGAGVLRWLKTAKYLPEYGWCPVILAPENADLPALDQSLEQDVPAQAEVLRQEVWEPYLYYKLLTGKNIRSPMYSGFIDEASAAGLMQRLALWIRGNIFIPDARKFWIKPSIKLLRRYLRENPVDVIVSTGPPHSTHMIALAVAKEFSLPWIADFRDPWTGIDYYEKLRISAWADRKHRRLEQLILESATEIVTVSNSWAADLQCIGGRDVSVISNGFDPQDFEHDIQPVNDKFTLAHVGAMNSDRTAGALWSALAELKEAGHPLIEQLHVDLIGPVDASARGLVHVHGLEEQVSFQPFLPHAEAVKTMQRAHLLLLPINKTRNSSGLIPGKFFEYLASQRPILMIGPVTGDCASIIQETGAGSIADFEDIEGVKHALVYYFELYLGGTSPPVTTNIETFSRRTLAGRYAQLFERYS